MFISGTAFFKEGKYPEAYLAFSTSYKLQPVLTALYNMAMCEMILGRYVESMASFEKLIEENGSMLKPSMRQKAEASIEKLKKLVGYLRLVASPTDAQLWINENRTNISDSGQPMRLNPGNYDIQITMDGHHPFETNILVESGATVVLQPYLLKKEASIETNESLSPAAPPVSPRLPDLHNENESLSFSRIPDPGAEMGTSVFHWTHSGWFVGGLTVAVAGLAGLGTGILSTWKQHKNREDAIAAGKRLTRDGDYEAYAEEYTDIRETRYPRAALGMKIGYIAGGAMVVAGVVIMMIDIKKGQSKKRELSLRPIESGVAFAF